MDTARMTARAADLFDLLPDEHSAGVEWRPVGFLGANELLTQNHYLGGIDGGELIHGGIAGYRLVAVQVWRHPTSRHLPSDGTWLELSRWCLTPEAGLNAGSRQHRAVTQYIRRHMAHVRILVSYSDPTAGHTGALYRACNWLWAPTWLRLRPPPGGHGRWSPDSPNESIKDRWVYPLRPHPRLADIVAVRDAAAIRRFIAAANLTELRMAAKSPAQDLAAAARAKSEAR